MITPTPKSCKKALLYLKDRATIAHLDGNGILVNHLAAIALDILKNEKSEINSLPASTWAWSVIYAHYWLIDSYMLFEIEHALKDIHSDHEENKAIIPLVKAYDWLIRQPLDWEYEDQKKLLLKLNISPLSETRQTEFDLILIHIVELLWFRDPKSIIWDEICQKWSKQARQELGESLTALSNRLKIQTSLTVLGARNNEGIDPKVKIDTEYWIVLLWKYVFESNYKGIDEILSAESAKHATNMPISRLLFDMRHYNRFHGQFGDPQTIGLTRRRIMTTSSPELVFHDTREECADSLISKLYLGSNSASDRFFGFTLLMLLELSALRRWDLSSWGEALHLQARLNAEIVLKEPSRLDFANRAVRNAVASFRLGTDDKWAPQVIRSLENLPSPDLDQLINDIINTNPVQYHCAKKIIEGLGDSIPESLYEEVAQWTVKYVSYAININQFGFNIGQIEFLAPILPEIPHNNPAWITLLPIFRNICSNSIIWQTSAREILRPILIYAPSEIAIELISLMLKIDSDAGANQSRWSLLCQVFENRNELADKFSYEFLKTAPSSDDLICLMDSSWSKKIPAIDEGSAKIRAVEHISKFIEKAVAKPGQKEFPMGLWSWLGVYYVKWSEEDKDTLLDLIRAIEALNVIDQNLPQLISYLTAMIANGPLLFSKLAAPKLNHWLTNPPIGINPMATNSDVFSIVKFTTNEKNLVTESLIYLAATVQRTLPDEDANYTIDYLCSISAEPPAGIASSIIQLALALAKKENNRRTELLGCCHAFLLTAHIRAKLDSTDSSDLIRSLRTLKHAMSEYSESPTLINELIRRIESLLCATAQSSLPKVRAATGALLTTLQKQISLSPALKNAYEKLVRDTRASVRRASGA